MMYKDFPGIQSVKIDDKNKVSLYLSFEAQNFTIGVLSAAQRGTFKAPITTTRLEEWRALGRAARRSHTNLEVDTNLLDTKILHRNLRTHILQ